MSGRVLARDRRCSRLPRALTLGRSASNVADWQWSASPHEQHGTWAARAAVVGTPCAAGVAHQTNCGAPHALFRDPFSCRVGVLCLDGRLQPPRIGTRRPGRRHGARWCHPARIRGQPLNNRTAAAGTRAACERCGSRRVRGRQGIGCAGGRGCLTAPPLRCIRRVVAPPLRASRLPFASHHATHVP